MPDPLDIPAETIASFCRRWRIRELSFFGSALGAEFRPDSDVDVLAVFETPGGPDLEGWADMEDDLKAIVGRGVDLVELELVKNPFRRHHILTHRRVVYAA